MFDVRLYQFSKKRNSTARPSGGTVYQCVSNEYLDILSPRLPLNITAEPSRFNYAFVPVFNRYYWITGWTYENGLWVSSMSVDELASWKTQIGGQTVYVLRSADESDGSIIDTTYPASIETDVDTQSISLWNANRVNSYMVGVAGKGNIRYYYMSQTEFTDFCTKMFDSDFLSQITQDWEDFASQATVLFNPIQYITSVKKFPFTLDLPTGALPVWLGWFRLPNFTATTLGSTVYYPLTKTITIPKHPQADERGEYLNCSPYSSYVLNVMPWGRFVLDPLTMKDVSSLTLNIKIDMTTGIGYLSVMAGDNELVFSAVQIAIDIPISQVAIDYLGALSGMVEAGTGVVRGAITGDIGGAITGAASGILDAASSMIPKVSVIGTQGGEMAWDTNATLYAEFHEVVDEDNEHHGRPLCKEKRLDTLDGYIMVSDPDISLPCTSTELEGIMGYLSTGFFME